MRKKKKDNIAKRMAGAIRTAVLNSKTGRPSLHTRVADDTIKQKNRRTRRNAKKNLRNHEG